MFGGAAPPLSRYTYDILAVVSCILLFGYVMLCTAQRAAVTSDDLGNIVVMGVYGTTRTVGNKSRR